MLTVRLSEGIGMQPDIQAPQQQTTTPAEVPTEPAVAPVAQPVAPAAPMKKGGRLKKAFVTLLILLLLAGAGALAYLWQQEKTASTKAKADYTIAAADLVTTKNNLVAAETEVAGLKEKFTNATSTSDLQYFSPQCEGKNVDNLLLAKLTKEPVQGHEAYLTLCRNELTKEDPLVRVTVLKIKDDGTKEFKYGASSVEPRCFSKSLGAVATELSKATGLPVCRS